MVVIMLIKKYINNKEEGLKLTENKEIERNYWNKKENTEGYEENNFSIFNDKGAKKLIIERLDKILCNPRFIIGDLGCGPGHILPYLSDKCHWVFKIDYAEKMLKEAYRRNSSLTNIKYLHGDLRNMSNWYEKFDVAIATNSILPESITEADEMVIEIFKSLKKGGVFVGVMPSIETVNYLARLRFNREINKGLSEKEPIIT